MSILSFLGNDKSHSFLLCPSNSPNLEWLRHPSLMLNLWCYAVKKENILGAEHSPVWKALRWEGGMEYFQLVVTDKDQPVHDQSRADQKYVAKGIVQIPLKHWQAWGTDHLSRKLFQRVPTPSVKSVSYLQSRLGFQFLFPQSFLSVFSCSMIDQYKMLKQF